MVLLPNKVRKAPRFGHGDISTFSFLSKFFHIDIFAIAIAIFITMLYDEHRTFVCFRGGVMQLSESIKLYPSQYQKKLILWTMEQYISTVNGLVSDAVNGHSITKLTTAGVSASLPSALKNQCI